jgi:hypothetical protein
MSLVLALVLLVAFTWFISRDDAFEPRRRTGARRP